MAYDPATGLDWANATFTYSGPDLESGNMLVKQLEYLGGAELAGVVLGARVPIILTSRADSARARIASCALATLYWHAIKR